MKKLIAALALTFLLGGGQQLFAEELPIKLIQDVDDLLLFGKRGKRDFIIQKIPHFYEVSCGAKLFV